MTVKKKDVILSYDKNITSTEYSQKVYLYQNWNTYCYILCDIFLHGKKT